jgi:hypothetical protein
MKIRNGFVSNSSSSSFVCDVCGEDVSGMDMGIADAEMIECTYSHVVCDSHAKNLQEHFDTCDAKEEEKRKEKEAKGEKWYGGYSGDRRYDVPPRHCPLCNLEGLCSSDELAYYRMRFGMDNEDVLEDIIETFKDYPSFIKAVSEARDNRRRE